MSTTRHDPQPAQNYIKYCISEDKRELDLLRLHTLSVIDDKAKFDGATPDQIRKHFDHWAADEAVKNASEFFLRRNHDLRQSMVD